MWVDRSIFAPDQMDQTPKLFQMKQSLAYNLLKKINIHVLFRFHQTHNDGGRIKLTIIVCESSSDIVPVRELWYHSNHSDSFLLYDHEWYDEKLVESTSHDKCFNNCNHPIYECRQADCKSTSCGHTYICSCDKSHQCSCDHQQTENKFNKCKYCQHMDDYDNICPITHSEITTPLMLKCNHKFEKSAILEWLSINNNCPVCRSNIS